jgi:hypothetical protein
MEKLGMGELMVSLGRNRETADWTPRFKKCSPYFIQA